MNYLTNHYKNLCEQYQSKINILQNLLNEDAPASTFSGTGQGQQTFSDQQLRDQMKQNKRTGLFGAEVAADKQNQAYKDAEAELARRQGASAKVDLDPSIKQSSDVKTDRVAGDWVERWANKLGEDPRKIEAMRRGVIDVLGGDAGKPMDTSMTSTQVAQRGVDAYNKAKEYVVGLQNQAKASAPASTPASAPTPSAQPVKSLEVYDRQLEVEKARQGSGEVQPAGPGRKGARPAKTEVTPEPETLPEPTMDVAFNPEDVVGMVKKITGLDQTEKPQENKITEIGIGGPKHTAPTYVVPESEDWSKMSPEEQLAMTRTALERGEAHKFFGGREAKKGGFLGIGGERTFRFSEHNGGFVPGEAEDLNRRAKLLNKLLDAADAASRGPQTEEGAADAASRGPQTEEGAAAKARETGAPTTQTISTSAGALESSRQLAQMYANRMGRRVSKAPATTPVPPTPKEQISSFESDFKTWQDRNARTRQMPLAMVGEQSPKGSNMEGQALENDSMARARYAQSVKTNAKRKAAEQEFVKRFGRLPNSKSDVDNHYMDTLLYTIFKS